MLKRNVVVLVVVAVVLGAGAFAWAKEAPKRPSLERGAAHTPVRPACRAGARAVHGDLIVRRKAGFENVTFDRGEVVRHGAESITLKRPDGVEVTEKINADTRFRGIDSAGAVVDGRPALVVSRGGTALLVGQPSGDAPACRRRSGNFRQGTTVEEGGDQVPAT
jgi:hypothetical protein